MTALNNQTQQLDAQEQALMAQLEALQAKKQAIISLESEYAECIAHVKKVMSLMTAAGLDSRNLLKDLAALVTPSTVSNRSTRVKSEGDEPLYQPGPGSQGERCFRLFDEILSDLGEVKMSEVKIRAAVCLPKDPIQSVGWYLTKWRKVQAFNVSPAPVVEPAKTPEPIKPTTPPVFEVSPAPEVTEAEAKAIDKQIEAEAKKVQAKKSK